MPKLIDPPEDANRIFLRVSEVFGFTCRGTLLAQQASNKGRVISRGG
jgi:hypothetical protein